MWIYVDLWEFKLYLMDDEETIAEYPVAIGSDERVTPAGIFFVAEMAINPQGYYRDVDGNGNAELGSRCISLNVLGWDGEHKIARGYAIHGTDRPDLIGTKHTKGCIRMLNSDIEKLYKNVFCGMKVVVWFSSPHDYINSNNANPMDYRLGATPNLP